MALRLFFYLQRKHKYLEKFYSDGKEKSQEAMVLTEGKDFSSFCKKVKLSNKVVEIIADEANAKIIFVLFCFVFTLDKEGSDHGEALEMGLSLAHFCKMCEDKLGKSMGKGSTEV